MASWIETGTLPDWLSGFVNIVTMKQRINQYLLDLAARVSDNGWQPLTFSASNFSAGSITPQYRQIGSKVYLMGNAQRSIDTPTGGAWNGANIFNNLPASACPSQQWIVPVSAGVSNDASVEIRVGTDGGIQMRNTGSVALPAGTNFGIWTSFPAG